MSTNGDLIRKAIEQKGVNQKEAAALLEISEQYLSDIVNGRRLVSPFVAVRLQHHFRLSAQILMDLQTARDLTVAWEEFKKVSVTP